MKTIVITGASSGIGKLTAKHFAEQGWQVAATLRKPENETELAEIDNIKLYALDVTDQASIDNAVTQILSDYETVEIVLNNTGYGLVGVFEATTPEQIRRQFALGDAEQTLQMRSQAGDDAFVAGIRQRIFS